MTDELKNEDNNKALQKEKRIKVYQHSDLLYWWVVWFYGLICASITRIQGTKIRLGEGPEVYVHSSAWVGISFICLVIFVLVFTSARARGMKSMVLLLVLALIAAILEPVGGIGLVSGWFALLKVHMNLAFYLFFSLTLLIFWIVAIFGFDRLTYWYFAPSEVGKKVVMSQGGENFVGSQVQITRHSDDVFVHRILGLWFLGFGTGDLDVHITRGGGGERHYELKNVWRIGDVEDKINQLVRSREHP